MLHHSPCAHLTSVRIQSHRLLPTLRYLVVASLPVCQSCLSSRVPASRNGEHAAAETLSRHHRRMAAAQLMARLQALRIPRDMERLKHIGSTLQVSGGPCAFARCIPLSNAGASWRFEQYARLSVPVEVLQEADHSSPPITTDTRTVGCGVSLHSFREPLQTCRTERASRREIFEIVECRAK